MSAITLPPDVEQYVESQLSGGFYPSRDVLVVEAIRLHREKRERLSQLKAELQIGIDELDNGLGIPMDADSIIRELDEELDEQGQPRCHA